MWNKSISTMRGISGPIFQGRKIDNFIVQFQIYLRRSKKVSNQSPIFPIINKITRHMQLFIKIRYSNCGRVHDHVIQ